MQIKLIALDLDGTVLKFDRSMSERVPRATKAAAERGVRVTIATGRGAPTVRDLADRLGVNAPVICQHGGTLTDLTTNDVLHRITLDPTLACEALAFARRHPSWHAVIFRRDDIIVEEQRFPTEAYSISGHKPIQVDDMCAEIERDAPDKFMLMLDPSETVTVLHAMSEFIGDRATVVQSSRRLVEVHSKQAHKGAALAKLAGLLRIPQEQVMAIGDHDNDETMLAWAGVGVAMGNASPRARTAARFHTESVDEDGAAIAIEKFVLSGMGETQGIG
jgi:Cof subfamily protein (haloacid dehalogenase superfamily)